MIAENRTEFLEKLQRVRNQVKSNLQTQSILSSTNSPRIVVGNWTFSCKKEGELHIQNSDGQQVLSICFPMLVFFKFFFYNTGNNSERRPSWLSV